MHPGKTYHLYTHANGSENLFRNHENYRYFLNRYQVFTPGVVDTLVWCLMPNHLHLLVRVKNEVELLEVFKNKRDQTGLLSGSKGDLSGLGRLERLVILQFSHLFNAYTKAYNKVYHRRGSLFIRAFKRKEITSDQYFSSTIHYIHTNPIRHGFTTKINEWPWSSYHGFLVPQVTETQKQVIDWFGGIQPFMQFHQRSVGPTSKEIDIS